MADRPGLPRGQEREREIDALARALESDSYRTRGAAVGGLSAIGGDRALSLIRGALTDPRKQVRARAAQALGRMGRRDALNGLIGALQDRTATVRKQAVDAVGKIARRDEVIQHLTPLLQDGDTTVAIRAVEVFGALRDPQIVAPLLAAAAAGPAQIQRPILLALAPLKDLGTVLLLCKVASEGSGGAAQLASRQLLQFGDSRALPRLLLKANDLPLSYRCEALEALRTVRIGGWLRAVLFRAVHPPIQEYCEEVVRTDTDEEARRGARNVLDHLNLLRGSERVVSGAEMLRAAAGGAETGEDELLRGSAVSAAPAPAERVGFWDRLFSRR